MHREQLVEIRITVGALRNVISQYIFSAEHAKAQFNKANTILNENRNNLTDEALIEILTLQTEVEIQDVQARPDKKGLTCIWKPENWFTKHTPNKDKQWLDLHNKIFIMICKWL